MTTRDSDKRAKFERFEEVALKVIAERGLHGLNVSYIAKKANLSRAWIYKYIGRERSQLIKVAAVGLGRRFARLDQSKVDGQTKEDLLQAWREGAGVTLDFGKKFPWITELYFTHLGKANPLGVAIEEITGIHIGLDQAKFQKVFGKSKEDARRLAIEKLSVRMTYAHIWARMPELKSVSREKMIENLCWFFRELQ
jgi:AcrR family transcriptional regulator